MCGVPGERLQRALRGAARPERRSSTGESAARCLSPVPAPAAGEQPRAPRPLNARARAPHPLLRDIPTNKGPWMPADRRRGAQRACATPRVAFFTVKRTSKLRSWLPLGSARLRRAASQAAPAAAMLSDAGTGGVAELDAESGALVAGGARSGGGSGDEGTAEAPQESALPALLPLARCVRTQRTPERGQRMMMHLLTRHSGPGTLEPNNGGALSGRPATAFEVDICAPRAPSVPPAATLRCGLPLPAATRHAWCLGGVWVAPSAACLSAAAGQHDSTELRALNSVRASPSPSWYIV